MLSTHSEYDLFHCILDFRTEPSIISVYEDDNMQEQAREIERETVKIRKEMEKARQRSRSVSPTHHPHSVPPKLLFVEFTQKAAISKVGVKM